ncbi:peptidase family M28 [Cercophora newfieldiana]|uniref:Peptide hydrolase n=1 Tax=Cercophora newfieldiana TaxID=92897 RepID=A0AA39Y8H1_9PEZI|nr:peptidase family M28 [Cercophora newfieldiana]
MRTPHAVTAAGVFAAGCLARSTTLTPEALVHDVRAGELQSTLWNLNRIANENGGNRAYGTPGYLASVDFVLERAQIRFGRKFDTYLQEFNHTYDELLKISVTGPDGEGLPVVVSPIYNPPTPTEGITAPLLNTPVDKAYGSMCWEDQWDGVNATGKLVLIRRGGCDVHTKLTHAKKNRALGVILYNNVGPKISKPTLFAEKIDDALPVGIIPRNIGMEWASRLDAGEDMQVTLVVDTILETRPSWNVISQTTQGDPDKVIMIGAHLDSVPEGPGINDDGTGTTALLEIMEAVEHYEGYPHSIRFAWWGSEEGGLVGSTFYTSELTPEEADKIKYYFNYDMIGSPNPMFGVMSDNNSGIGAQLLEDYLTDAGKEVTYRQFDNRSDYAGFVALGIPSTGLFTGEGEHDPCYHQACDTIDNVDLDALTLNTKAAAHALGTLASSLEGVPKRANVTPNLRRRRKTATNFQLWKTLAEEAGRGHSCAHGKMKLTV